MILLIILCKFFHFFIKFKKRTERSSQSSDDIIPNLLEDTRRNTAKLTLLQSEIQRKKYLMQTFEYHLTYR